LRLFSFGGYGLALAALALVVFGAIECPPKIQPLVLNLFPIAKLSSDKKAIDAKDKVAHDAWQR